MNLLATAFLSFGLIAALLPVGAPQAEAASNPIKFGMDAASVGKQSAAGVKPDYGTFWIGPWTLKSGWAGPDAQMDKMKAAGVTPAIHFYYWGDDITQSCLENGCYSSLHGTQKNKAGWNQLTTQFVQHLNERMGGKPVLVFLETEFNKANVQTYEPLDGYLAEKARAIKAGYPNAKVVLALGNWNSAAWSTWDRAAAASDFTGIQAMRGSTRDSASHYDGAYDATLSGAKVLQSKFGKPIVIQDVALSSYPEPAYLSEQSDNLRKFFTGLPALKAAGVQAILYRSWSDTNMDTANYYGQAERHWGLTYASGGHKASAGVWINGVKAERGSATAPAPSTTSPSPSGGYSATFTVASGSNTWWQEVKVSAPSKPAKVDIQVNGGSWQPMSLKSWGNWATSQHVAKGTPVTFRATAGDGSTATSPTQPWLASTTTTASPTASFSATFSPKSVGNDWWVESAVTSSTSIAKVEVKLNSGSWQELPKNSWGTYSKSLKAPNGTQVTFKATATNGATATSQAVTWT